MADEASHLPSCQRCKLRKIRCDHAAPKCSACLKAATTCVIVDPITLKQYTREYIHDLERKEKHLSEKARKRLGPRRTSNARSPRDPPSAESTTTFGGYVGENSSLKLVSNVENGAIISSNVWFSLLQSVFANTEWRTRRPRETGPRPQIPELAISAHALPSAEEAAALLGN